MWLCSLVIPGLGQAMAHAEKALGSPMTRTIRRGNEQRPDQHIDQLIARYIEPYPGRPDPADSRLKVDEGGVPVWALIGALAKDGSNIDAVARDYDVHRAAVEAARAFYQRRRRGSPGLLSAPP
jgi:uncharacterized protein (DUF433 family)